MSPLKKIVSHLPALLQEDLKRYRFRRQIKKRHFVPDEPEINTISTVVRQGDWVIDVGANVGHYTCHLSDCVGTEGRVIAFEPVLSTFTLLAANIQAQGHHNVTLLNMAASDEFGSARMELPSFSSGLSNYYRASISDSGNIAVQRVPIDSMHLPTISLIKVDAEGHDLSVLQGAENLINRDHPVLIVECALTGPIAEWIFAHGYRLEQFPGSPNCVATHPSRVTTT